MQKTPYTSVVIDPTNDVQVQHWAKEMQITPGQLRGAIRLIGPRLGDIRRYFGKSAAIIPLESRRRPAAVSPYGLPA